MNTILVTVKGPPGSGKSTLCRIFHKALKAHFDMPGVLVRVEEETPAGMHLSAAMPQTIPLIYIMSPYSDPSERVRRNRYRTVEFYTGRLMCKFPHAMFYSPIAYCHPIAVDFGLPTDATFWEEHNNCIMARSQLGIVLRDSGWQGSEGISKELTMLDTLKIPHVHDDIDSEHEVVGEALQKLA